MATTQDLITQSFKEINVTAAGETPAPSELTDALVVLNQIMSSRSRQKAWVHTVVHATFPLQVGVRDYTIGPTGASFPTTPRPVKITAANVRNGSFSRDMPVVSFDELQARSMNATGATEVLPGLLAADNAFPNINLRVFTTPSAVSQLDLTWWNPLSQFATLAENIDGLPDGYQRALKFTLAMELAPGYGRPVTAELAALASDANNEVIALNKSINDPMPPPQPAQST